MKAWHCSSLFILISLTSGSHLFAQDTKVPIIMRISKGEPVKHQIVGEEIHLYKLFLKEEEFVDMELEVYPESLILEVFAPGGKQIQQQWQFSDDDTPFRLNFFAEEEGDHEVRISLGIKDAPQEPYHLHTHAVTSPEVEKRLDNLEEVRKWLSKTGIPLKSVEINEGVEDLMILKEILKDVRIVGLGEATHGSKEFFQIKHKFLEFLVKELEFTHFAIEGSISAARAVNNFVLNGEGDPGQVLKEMGFWQWDTPEVAGLIDWMFTYNKTVPEDKKLKFIGFDFQVNKPAARELISFLNSVAPLTATEAQMNLESLWKNIDHRPSYVEYYTFSKEKKDSVIQQVVALKSFMEKNRLKFAEQTSEKDYLAALKNLQILNQFAVTYNTPGYDIKDPNSGTAMRDRFMAEHLLEILDIDGAKAKIMVWSHNEHVKRDPYNMGYYLSEKLREKYYAVGIGFYEGSFTAIELTDNGVGPIRKMTVGPSFQNSVEWFIKPLDLPVVFFDFRKAPASGPVYEWLRTPLDMRSIGNGFYILNPGGYFRPPVKLSESYDGFIYIDKVSGTILNNPVTIN